MPFVYLCPICGNMYDLKVLQFIQAGWVNHNNIRDSLRPIPYIRISVYDAEYYAEDDFITWNEYTATCPECGYTETWEAKVEYLFDKYKMVFDRAKHILKSGVFLEE